MIRRCVTGLVVMCLSASLALADAPGVSLVPKARPAPPAVSILRPKPRPILLVAQPLTQMPAAPQKPATPQMPAALQKPTAKGSVCGNPAIKGVALQAIKSRIKACNVSGPVSVTAIDGIPLVPAATINCDAAQALATWVEAGLQPQFNNQVARLIIADSYSCRPRNNVPGGKISEHGSGNAIDISGVVLTSGKVLTVASNFSGALRAAHKAACGVFHTTLGPGSDGYHENHMHLDVASYRGNPYCR